MFRTAGGDIQAGTDRCPANAHAWKGSDPHATFEQGRPAVNKEEPAAFANPCEAGAKKASEDVMGKRMPESGVYT
jgi:hypothetical protein